GKPRAWRDLHMTGASSARQRRRSAVRVLDQTADGSDRARIATAGSAADRSGATSRRRTPRRRGTTQALGPRQRTPSLAVRDGSAPNQRARVDAAVQKVVNEGGEDLRLTNLDERFAEARGHRLEIQVVGVESLDAAREDQAGQVARHPQRSDEIVGK